MNISDIFKRKKKNVQDNITMVRKQENTTSVWDFFVKGILVFLLSYGSVGGFLSAYEISYDWAASAFILGAAALLLSAAYASGKKALKNIVNIALVMACLVAGSQRFLYINSGYYAIANMVTADAMDYLGLYNGTQYLETIGNSFATVTYFTIFIGVILEILLNIELTYRMNIYRVAFLTLPLYLIPVYFEHAPQPFFMICLLAGYLCVWCLGLWDRKQCSRRLLKYLLPAVLLFCIVVIKAVNIFFPERIYGAIVSQNEYKLTSQKVMSDFVIYGPAAFFSGSSVNSGVSGGILSNAAMVRMDYETDLIVKYTPYSMETVYLKAFTGMDYEGSRWLKPSAELLDYTEEAVARDVSMEQNVDSLKKLYESSPQYQGRGIMEVTNVGAAAGYSYYPYYTESVHEEDTGTEQYVYYPSNRNAVVEDIGVDERYLTVAESCRGAVETVCRQAGFSGSAEQIAGQIITFFDENYTYTLRPGYQFGGNDYITYFLMRNKKGYCAHFASAAVMMFRYMGIPARYVEGYVLSYNDVMLDGELVSDAAYEDYYDGYSQLGETGVVTVEIPDSNAHAWVEIYIEGKGWIVVDPTPSARTENTESFWDVFQKFQTEAETAQDLEDGEGFAGAYLKNAVNTVVSVAVCVVLAGLLLLLIRKIRSKKREKNMKMEDRIRILYVKIVRMVTKKHKEFSKNTTIHEQVSWMNQYYNITENERNLAKKLYDAFFGPDMDEEESCELLDMLVQCKKSIQKKERKF